LDLIDRVLVPFFSRRKQQAESADDIEKIFMAIDISLKLALSSRFAGSGEFNGMSE
jgi:hypothetical protein